ncbi:MAG: response regulator transcription factor [Ruminococcus sp.]|nr:response regulator transcription factor [Ruminococcus sp.]
MRKILIVEDDSEINKLLADFLQSNGYETVCADDGQKAIMLMKKQDFCLVIMDLMLPYRNGEQLIKEFREYSQIPVIVLSAKSMMETRLAVLKTGADDYIIKPFDLNEVLVRIEVVLRRSGTGEEAADKILSCGELCLNTTENTVSYVSDTFNLDFRKARNSGILMT